MLRLIFALKPPVAAARSDKPEVKKKHSSVSRENRGARSGSSTKAREAGVVHTEVTEGTNS